MTHQSPVSGLEVMLCGAGRRDPGAELAAEPGTAGPR